MPSFYDFFFVRQEHAPLLVHHSPAVEGRAKAWIIRNQLSRRNITPFVRAKLALKLKPLIAAQAKERMSAGWGNHPGLTNLSNLNTREKISQEAHVSEGTLHKVEKILAQGTEGIKGEARKVTVGASEINHESRLPKLLRSL